MVPRCNVYQEVKNGSIRWYTPGGSNGCEVWIFNYSDNSTIGYRDLTTTKAYSSAWYADGRKDVCVNNSEGQMVCGVDSRDAGGSTG